MNYKKLFFFLIVCATSASFYVPSSNAMLPANAFNDPQQKEIFDFVSGLDQEQQEQLLNEIFEEVSKLPPEQQKEFWQEVEQEAVKLEEQMKEFEPAPLPQQPAADLPEIKKPVAPEAVKPAEPVVEKKALPAQDIKKAEQLLESLIQELERFLRKVTLIPGIEAKINRWIAQGYIKNTPAGTLWPTIVTDIEQSKQKLYELVYRDPKTNKHKHLPSLLEYENLYNNLSRLERTLTQQGPLIDVPDFGSSQLSEKTRSHIQQALNVLVESLYILKISEDLSKVIGEYQPYAQKIKEEQEGLQQIAQTKAGKQRTPSPLVRAGTLPPEPRTDQTTKYRPFRPEYSAPTYSPAERPSGDQPSKEATAQGQACPVPSASGQKGAPDKEKPAGPVPKPDVKKTEEKKDKEKDGDKDKPKEDSLSKEYLSSIEKNLEAALDLISSSKLSTIRPYLLSNTPVDVKLATDTIPAVTALFDKVLLKAKSLDSRISKRIKDPVQQKKYKEEARDIVSTYKPTFDKISSAIKSVKIAQASISPDKQYVYLDGVVQPTDATLLAQVPTPASLYRLQEKIDEFFKAKKK